MSAGDVPTARADGRRWGEAARPPWHLWVVGVLTLLITSVGVVDFVAARSVSQEYFDSLGYGAEQVIINRPAELTVDGMAKGYCAYMVRQDGTLANLNAKFDDNSGLLSFGGTLTGPVIVTDKALTATAVSAGGNGTTSGSGSGSGSTQNPATGAADFIGVAAALLVITGVSAAAISLKKD